ncbi:glucokinase [Ktedonobacter sp. SOSP1-52]|uniref:ROK family protein n=1 Tax=Ktedonobacter sp. SOSP1-52 TaxID=2778366 RepID=UPI0019150368|nr:ROK family protein [Ktedonobacter sp. SOSP1-52]GHO69248.1 glucokinase [Ktedonobacter sp. SOSP1-52]
MIGDNQTTYASYPLVVGVDLGGTQIRAAVLQGATLLSRANLLTGDNGTPERVIPRLFQAVDQALADAQLTPAQIAGIGIAAPGPLNNRTGVVISPPNLPGWTDIPLRDIFAEHYQLPIYLENDANAAGLGEHLFGAGRGSNEMVYLTISTGIGGGVITNGKILEGIAGAAGELGHITVDWRGEPCGCGNVGCLEGLASGTGIARRVLAAIARGEGEELLRFARQQQSGLHADEELRVDARLVAQAATAGVFLAQQVLGEASEALGVGLVNIIHIFNPELIVLGGGLMQMGEQLLAPARAIVQQRAMQVPREMARIVPAELGPNVGLVGAGALIYYNQA